jgi:hypothetical protein
MSRKRPSFPEEWWKKVSQFLEDNPELGFESDQQREFLMWLTNSFIENDQVVVPENKFEEIIKEVKDDLP